MTPWDQRLARVLVKPLARTPITPNHVTVVSLGLAVLGACLLASGEPVLHDWGAGVFVLSRFMDHFDGELARLIGRISRLGYHLDYLAGALSYGALFVGIGFGLRGSAVGGWMILLGLVGAASAVATMRLNLGIDALGEHADAVDYPSFAGFELEDGIYLLAPITWLGYLQVFFVAAAAGAFAFLLWTGWRVLRTRSED